MALKRELLKGMGLTDEQVTAIIEAHAETVDGLKGKIEELKTEAGKAKDLQKELDALKGGTDWKAEHDKVKKELDDFKKTTEAKETAAKVKAAYRGLLKDANIDEKRFDAIIRATDLSGMKLDRDGKLENADKLTDAIKADWSDFVVTAQTRGAQVKTPPAGGKATRTREEIMAIKDTGERQRAMAENPELFGI